MIGAKKRFEVLKRDNFRCQYCGRTGKDVTLEVDHIVPKAKDGTDDLNNLITCCRECNIGKGQEELNSWNSKLNVKIKDVFNHIKNEFYRRRNEEIKRHEESINKRINGTINLKTMSLLASFLQRWLDDRIKDTKRLRQLVDEGIETIILNESRIEEGSWRERYTNAHPILKSLKEDPSLIDGKIQEFYEGGDFFDELTSDFAGDFIANDCYFDSVFNDDIRNTDDMDERLNYKITCNINGYDGAPGRITRKYSYYPNATRHD